MLKVVTAIPTSINSFKKLIESWSLVVSLPIPISDPLTNGKKPNKILLASLWKSPKKENISQNVMHSLKLDEARKWELIKNRLGPVLRFFFKQIGGVKGSHIYEGLSKGSMISMAYVLKKPELSS